MDSSSVDEESTQIVSSTAAPADSAGPLPVQGPVEVPLDPALFGVAPVAAAPRNYLALLGVILAVPLWPVGLVLSALGLFNAVARRTGKVMAIIGLVLSVVTGGAIVAALTSATSTVAASTALDPGCISIEANLATELATLKTDTATLEANENSASSSNSSIGTVNADLSAIQADLTTAIGGATHADVKSDLNTMTTQVQAVGTSLTGIQGHSTSSEGAAAAALTTLQSTDANLDARCATY